MEYKILCEKILEIERNNDLFNRKIRGVFFWKIVRFALVSRITQEKRLLGQSHTYNNQSLFSRIKYAVGIFFTQRHTSAISRSKKRDILVFDHPRKIKVNGEYIDIYTHDFISELRENEYEVIERSFLRKHLNKPSENRSFEEYFSPFDYIRYIVLGVRLDKEERRFLADLESQINSALGTSINIKKFVTAKLNNFYLRKNYFNKLLKKRRPRSVYLVVSYVYEPLIAACRENHIKTIEFQHGTMSKYHFGYSFPNDSAVPYFPDKMILFGKYWYDATPLPISEENVTYRGFPYLRNSLIRHRGCSKGKNTILFISQGSIGKELSRIAHELARKRNDLEITYKLHPGEFVRWREEYGDLIEAEQLPNLTVVENENLHGLQAVSEYQIGVYSTAIFEGLVMDCKTILMQFNGIEYMDFLIKNQYVEVAQDSAELNRLIENSFSVKEANKGYFFSGVEE